MAILETAYRGAVLLISRGNNGQRNYRRLRGPRGSYGLTRLRLVPIIVDIDDTLLRNGVQPIERVIEYVNSLSGSIFIVTGRTTSQQEATVKALADAGVNYERLLMNPYGADKTLKWKQEIALRYFDAELAIDNDPDARAIYRAAGIPTKDPATI